MNKLEKPMRDRVRVSPGELALIVLNEHSTSYG